MSLEPVESKPKEKKTPTLHSEMRKTRRAYLRSLIKKKEMLGIPLTESDRAMKALFDLEE